VCELVIFKRNENESKGTFMKTLLSHSQLHTLLESTKLINSTLDLDELLNLIMNEITTNLSADRSTLYIVDDKKDEIWSKIAQGDKKLEIRQPIGKGISGYVAEKGKVINIVDAYQDPRFNPEVDKKSGYHTKSILCMPVRDKSKKIIAVLQVLNKKRGSFSKEDELFISVFSDYIALAIQNAQLYQEALERKKLEDEMAIAGEIQKMLLPSASPQYDNFGIYSFHRSSRRVGGDYYDFFDRGDQLFFILADVSGKGIPAALLMANLQATTQNALLSQRTNMEIVERINQHLFSITPPDKYATMVWGNIDLNKDIVKYIIAGHVPPLHFRANGKNIKISELRDGGIPIGLVSEFKYLEGNLKFKPEDILLICSDGITEAQNKNEDMFEIRRVKDIVIQNFHESPEEIGKTIIQEVDNFSQDGVYEDDVTLLIIKRNG
jgi:sigma-B regulation protein RsbU (phosphoserine phosphatase)